jgi:glycosyltransferase involved in cell wall biosynthesis
VSGPVLHWLERWLPLSEQFVHTLIRHLQRPGIVVSRLAFENVELYDHRPRHSLRWVRPPLPATTQRRLVTGALLALRSRHRASVLHAHHGYRTYELRGFLDRSDLPLVVSLHGHDVAGYSWERPGTYEGVLDRARAVIVPSEFLVPHAVAAGASADRVHVIASGVDTEWFTPSPVPLDSSEVVFVGRFVEKKGIDTLLDAWSDVQSRVPSARLRLLGYGPLEPLARSRTDGVEVVLRPDRGGVRDAIGRARAVVSPSRTAPDDAFETLLVVNLEAQASGRPVVTTNHGGIPEYVADGQTALVVPEADPGALAAALIEVLTDDVLARRLGGAGPRFIAERRLDVASSAARVDGIYDSIT